MDCIVHGVAESQTEQLSVDYCGLPGGSDGKESPCNAGDLGLIPGSGRFPEEENATLSSILAWITP